jgi:putative endonuclease
MGRQDRHDAQQLGVRAEAFVAAYLADEGFVVVDRNWTGAGAEIDLIVRNGGVVRFVEVKARDEGDVRALESVGPRKQHRLRRAAELWLLDQEEVDEAAFLVAWVEVGPDGAFALTLIDDAF